jgi:hypothetical protein
LVLFSALSICLEGLLVLCLHDVIQAYVRLAQMRFLAITACANATSLSIWFKTVLRCPTSQFCCTCRLHDVVNSNFYSQAPGCLKPCDNSTEVATRRILRRCHDFMRVCVLGSGCVTADTKFYYRSTVVNLNVSQCAQIVAHSVNI